MTVIAAKDEKKADDHRKSIERAKQEHERRRAMALGHFSFLDEANKTVLDENSALLEAAREWKTANRDERKRIRIQYEPAPELADGDGKAVSTLRRSRGYEAMVLPRAGENFMVVWVNGKGQVAVDRDVMLLNMKEVITTKEDQPEIIGPKDPGFGNIERSEEINSDSSFDLDLFWSVGFLYKHYKSCGLLKWDKQMAGLKRDMLAMESRETSKKSNGRESGRRRGSGKFQGKLTGWKGTYGFIQCTSGDFSGKTIFLHHTDIISPYLNLVRGLPFRFDVVTEGEGAPKLRAIKAQPCLCKFSCTVHEADEVAAKKSQQGRRRRPSSKSSGSAKRNVSAEAGTPSASDVECPENSAAHSSGDESSKRPRGNKRRQFGRKPRKTEAVVAEA